MKSLMRFITKNIVLSVIVLIVFTLGACSLKEENIDGCDDALSQHPHIGRGGELEGRGGELEPVKFTSGDYKDQYNPADIRGSITIADISRYFDIPVSVLCEAFHIPIEEAETVQNKYYKYIFQGLAGSGKSIGNGSMVLFVSMYKGIPVDIHEPEYLLVSAANILKSVRELSSEQMAYLEKYSVTLEEAGPVALADLEIPVEHPDKFTIYGRTTFGDLLQMGIRKEQIGTIINAPMPDLSIRVKDYCVANGLPFSDYVKPEIFEILYSMQD